VARSAAILLSNVRAAFLASEWKPLSEDDDRPTRFSDSIGDKLVDQLPQRAWRVLQVPFFVLSSSLLLVCLAGLGVLIFHRLNASLPNGWLRP